MSDYGIKISEAGYDVKTCDDVNLILKSSFTLLKVFSAGTASLSGGTGSVYHGLGYKPQFLVYGLVDASTDYVLSSRTSNSLFSFDGIFASVSDNYLYFYADSTISSAYFYIFYETL